MERVTVFLLIFSMKIATYSFPIENGFSFKFNPISAKEDLKPKKFGASFAKIPQNFNEQDEVRRDVLTKGYYPKKPDAPSGYTNQVAKLLFPTKYFFDSTNNSTRSWANQINYLNLPLVKQPYDSYKILVATAPPNVHLGGDSKRTIIYVVFPEEEETGVYNIPTIYFVNEKSGRINSTKKVSVDPILIIDSNRTVTGLKSKEVAKFVRFKSKWTNRFNYKITR